jgi:hypothetical protein
MNELKIKIKSEEERQFLFFITDIVAEIGYRILDYTNLQPNTYLINAWNSIFGKVEFIHLADKIEVRIIVINNYLYNHLLKSLKGAKTPLRRDV